MKALLREGEREWKGQFMFLVCPSILRSELNASLSSWWVCGNRASERAGKSRRNWERYLFLLLPCPPRLCALTKTAPLFNASNYELYWSWKVIQVFEGELITEV